MSGLDRLRYSARTHVGRVRDVNEDSILALPDDGIWVVADGMGGHEGGDFASQAIIELIAMIPSGLDPRTRMTAVRDAIRQAHANVRREGDRRGHQTIGSTVVAIVLARENFVAFWVGDSRLYRLRDGELQMLSSDHSAVAPMVESGQLTWDQAEKLPDSNVITRAVGVGDSINISKVRGHVSSGDRFLLCSDGLSKYFGFTALRDVLANTPMETVTDKLLEAALEAGGADNISIIVIDVP
jgi:serine/threonine-protein phosphatase Stp1